MKVLVEGKELDVSPAIREFIDTQVNRKLDKFSHRIMQIRVYLEQVDRKDNDPHRSMVRYNVDVAGMNPIVISNTDKDMYKAIVGATEDLVRQLRRIKEKRIAKRYKNGVGK
jgi:ribosomal subunit interface protein